MRRTLGRKWRWRERRRRVVIEKPSAVQSQIALPVLEGAYAHQDEAEQQASETKLGRPALAVDGVGAALLQLEHGGLELARVSDRLLGLKVRDRKLELVRIDLQVVEQHVQVLTLELRGGFRRGWRRGRRGGIERRDDAIKWRH